MGGIGRDRVSKKHSEGSSRKKITILKQGMSLKGLSVDWTRLKKTISELREIAVRAAGCGLVVEDVLTIHETLSSTQETRIENIQTKKQREKTEEEQKFQVTVGQLQKLCV
jgi:valyl-tRNA synthetase